jgi:hypothetical protein
MEIFLLIYTLGLITFFGTILTQSSVLDTDFKFYSVCLLLALVWPVALTIYFMDNK